MSEQKYCICHKGHELTALLFASLPLSTCIRKEVDWSNGGYSDFLCVCCGGGGGGGVSPNHVSFSSGCKVHNF